MNPSKEKGSRLERAIVALFHEYHLDAWRVPLSGAARGFKGDVKVKTGWDEALTGECKARANGFKFIYASLEGNDFLVIRADRKEALVVIPAKKYAELLQ